jgi:hypothetical protein
MIFAPFAFRNQARVAAAAAAPTLSYEVYAYGFTTGTFKIYINGTLYQTMTTDTSLVTVTLNAGDTFYSTLQNTDAFSPGGTVDYFLNGSFVTSYALFTTGLLTTPTVTSVAGNTYRYIASFGAV